MVTDSHGLPLAVTVTPGQRHESRAFEDTLDAVRIVQARGGVRRRPLRLAGDKGYSYDWIRKWLARRRIEAIIPRRSNQPPAKKPFDREAYRRRNVVERCINWLKECRRIGTRFEKLAATFLAMLKLAILGRYFRKLFSYTP